MKRLLVLALSSTSVALGLADSAAARVTTLRTTYLTTSFQVVDNPPANPSAQQPPSPGDVALIRSRYTSGGKVVAFERSTCTVVDWPNAVCSFTFKLAGGHLVASDQINALSRTTQRVAVTGGTGAYRSARGEVAFKQASDTRGTAVFTIVTG